MNPSVETKELHRVDEAEAIRLVETHIGQAASWVDEMIGYRLSAEFQRDWKIEVGQWLATAAHFGYLEKLLDRSVRVAKPLDALQGRVDPDSPAFKKLFENLAPALIAHYFLGTGWSFIDFERSEPPVDVDVELRAPSGSPVLLQVKAPDEYEEERDDWVQVSLRKAGKQLPIPARQPAIVALIAKRQISLASDTYVAESVVLGSSVGPGPVLTRDRAGLFATDWRHVGAVALFGHVRGLDRFTYPCSLLLNPWCEPVAQVDPAWFPRARVLSLQGSTFRWSPEPPTALTYFPDGTRFVDDQRDPSP